MATTFKKPEEIAEEYLLNLKTLKPEVDTKRKDSGWYIRSRVVGGVVSGVYSDQRLISNDAFPHKARREALAEHLFMYFNGGFKDAQSAVGFASVTGTVGSTVTVGLEFLYEPNGNVYQATENVTLSATTGLVPVISVATGQSQNLLSGAALKISSPPAGINNLAEAYQDFTDGREIESNAEAVTRILDRIRTPIAGGKESDYKQFARDADPSVVSASVIRYPFGFGTLAIIITAGTTDIDTAIDNGDPVILIPSQTLIDKVQAYIDEQKILTDCVYVTGPVEVPVDVTVRVRYLQGSGSTILSGQTLTQQELVQREVKRAIYRTPPGGRRIGSSGFVIASEIEEVIDTYLSASPNTVGLIEMLVDRQVSDLSATGNNLMILANQLAIPGAITVLEM